MPTPVDATEQLSAAFKASLDRALTTPGTRPPSWPLHLPAPLLDSILAATKLNAGTIPDALLKHYAERMPEALIDQFFRTGDGREWLWERFRPRDWPALSEARRGIEAALRSVDLDPGVVLPPMPTDATGRTCVAELYAPTMFASGLPFLGAHAGERALIRADLESGGDLHEILDRRLSGNLAHEWCHGRVVEGARAPPWHLGEAASLHLGATGRAAHVFPDRVGEAIPGVARFVLLGDGIARLFGKRALWSLVAGVSTADAFGARAAAVFEVAEWQDWLRRLVPPFAFDANDAIDWIKLADAARMGSGPAWLDAACAIDPLDRAALDVIQPLAESSRGLAWRDLPWWHEAPTPDDVAFLHRAFDAMFLVNRMAPTFQTQPDEVPGGVLVLDVVRCELSAKRRPGGVWAEPATWLVPPPLCRALDRSGVRTVRFEGVRRADRTTLAARLLELAEGSGPCDASSVIVP